MVRYSFLVRLSHPLLHAGLSRRLLDHLVRSRQDNRRNRQADLVGLFQIADEFEFLWLLKGQSDDRVLIKEANRVTRFSLVMAFLRLTFPPIAGLFLRS
jgi:hypothetical protein